jgi:hypothetical protein
VYERIRAETPDGSHVDFFDDPQNLIARFLTAAGREDLYRLETNERVDDSDPTAPSESPSSTSTFHAPSPDRPASSPVKKPSGASRRLLSPPCAPNA